MKCLLSLRTNNLLNPFLESISQRKPLATYYTILLDELIILDITKTIRIFQLKFIF